jgi:hypothetical protein
LPPCRAHACAPTPHPSLTSIPPPPWQVAFDPLDGSSIVDANFAVGSIFGVWPGPTPLGQTGRDQAAAMYSLYGPRTLFVLAFTDGGGNKVVHQYIQQHEHQRRGGDQGQRHGGDGAPKQQQCSSSGSGGDDDHPWVLHRVHTGLRHTKIIAPANLRAAADNQAYRTLMDTWISQGYKLRYSGGMVPDVHHILAKVGCVLVPFVCGGVGGGGRVESAG